MVRGGRMVCHFFAILFLIGFLAVSASAAEKSLYERLGGAPAVEAVIADFVNRTAVNPAVNFTRQGKPRVWDATADHVALLKKRLIQFVSVAAGAKDVVYEGQNMKTAHAGMQITNAEFDAMAADLKASLDKFNVPAKEQQELIDIVSSARGMVVEEKKS